MCTARQEQACFSHETQRFAKRLDMFCAISALLGSVACQGHEDVARMMLVGLPLFVGASTFKRIRWLRVYMVLHGAWHVVTASLLWVVLYPAFAQSLANPHRGPGAA